MEKKFKLRKERKMIKYLIVEGTVTLAALFYVAYSPLKGAL